jgi:hypothetical protein
MVLEKVLTQISLPESLAKAIEEFAGIYRPPGYMKLRESLQPVLDEHPKRWGGGRGRRVFPAGGALAIYSSKKWVYWRCDPIYADLTWYVFLKNKVQQGCPRLLWRHVRIRWD